MAITVTATQGGSTGASLLLRVFVLTGAKAVASQAGASTNNQFSATTTWTQSITTTAGSNVYGAGAHGTPGSTDTGSNTTIVDDVSDATNSWQYVTFKALNVTSGATARGFTIGSAQSGPFAQLEILAAATLAEDGSAPAVASGAGTANLTVTTASFTPPAGSLLVAIVSSNGGSGVTTMTVSDSSSLAWTEKVKNNPSNGDYAGVWIADVPAGASAVLPFQPGKTWRRQFRHRQLLLAPPPAAPVNGVVPLHLVVARRTAARASWRGFISTTTNAPPANVPGTAPLHLVVARRVPARASWRGFVSTTANAAVQLGAPFAGGAFIAHRRTVGGLWGGAGLQGSPPPPKSGIPPLHLVVARRGTARTYWRGYTSRTSNNTNVSVVLTILQRIPQRVPHRAYVRMTGTRTVNASAAAAVSGTAPLHLVIARRAYARAFWHPTSTFTTNLLPGSVQSPATRQPRRYPARASWHGFTSSTTNLLPGSVQPPATRQPRRPAARASWRGFTSTTVNAVPFVPPSGTAPLHLVIGRRASARASWRGFTSSTVNTVPTVSGTAPDHLVVARRSAARASWRGFTSRTTNLLSGNAPGGLVRRRAAARAVWHGNAALPQVSLPVTDGLVKRRTAARAYWAGTVVRTVNAVPAGPVNGTAPDHLVIARRLAARAVWRPTSTKTANLQNGNQPGGLIRRRSAARAIVIGRPPRGAPFVPPPGTAPKNLVIKRRAAARAYAQWIPVVTVNAPPPLFLKGYSTDTNVGEAASMQASAGEAASMQASVGEAASAQGSVQ